jgi:predicted transcriptional regulator
MKRTHKEIKKEILKALSDDEEHSYGYLERKVNTNWQTVRNHCEDLELFNAIQISHKKVKITKTGINILKKIIKSK